jgi:hypothetical protein
MSSITKDLDSLYPDYQWWESDMDFFVSDLEAKGVKIGTDSRTGRLGKEIVEPAISFSGFCSQGDGLAFDCTIDWTVFFHAHPEFAEQMPHWYLLLVANPFMVEVNSIRHSRGNSMSVNVGYNAYYEDDHGAVTDGFFAGVQTDELPMTESSLETYMYEYLDGEASRMYRELESTYDSECEYMRDQRKEELKEQYADNISAAMSALPDVFTRTHAEECLDAVEGVVDFADLDELGYVVRWLGTWMKKEVRCDPKPL